MKAERQHKEATSRVIQPSKGGGHIVDNRPHSRDQLKIVGAIQKKADGENLYAIGSQIQLMAGSVIQRDSTDFSFSVLGGRTRQWIGRRITAAFGNIRRDYTGMQNGGEQVWIRLSAEESIENVRISLEAAGIEIGTIEEGWHNLT